MDRDQVAADLKSDEGWRPNVYEDHLGYKTIGFGFLVDDRKGDGMPEEIGEIWLNYEIDAFERGLKLALSNWSRYPDQIQRALLNMSYQMGIGGLLGFRNTLRLIDDGRYQEAATEALNSRWAEQTPERAGRVAEWIADA